MGKTVEVCLPKDLRDAKHPPENTCAMAYAKALEVGADDIQITQWNGWKTRYTLAEMRAFLMKSPWHHGLVRMGETLGMDEVEKFRYRQQQFRKTRGLFVPA
jgi:hypothetical protein